jgi:hypothetical protein
MAETGRAGKTKSGRRIAADSTFPSELKFLVYGMREVSMVSRQYPSIVFTQSVRDAQEHYGTRAQGQKLEAEIESLR